ncbi:MAG: carbohydrate ABC transporter permease [Clostridiaceae bacterium]|nr:carbohydrate ABC transporter permease [Clostridiaceae bacterium]
MTFSGRKIKSSREDIIFEVITNILLVVACLIVLYPLYFIIIASISNPDYVIAGKLSLYPIDVTFSGYRKIFKFKNLMNGYKNSFFYAIVGGALSATLTLFAAYPLSKHDFSGRKPFTIFLLITMFFQGGMIPLYIVVNKLGLRNTPYVLLIVNGIQVWNLLVTRSYFKTNHIESLSEAAEIDGCSHFGYFFKILLPISKPIIITMLLFYAVWQWNDFFRAMIYLDKPDFQPLQIVLKELLATAQVSSAIYDLMEDQEALTEMLRAAEQMKYGVIVIATLPMMVVYLIMQEYFVQGITMGSIKG